MNTSINCKIEVVNEGKKAILRTWNTQNNEPINYE